MPSTQPSSETLGGAQRLWMRPFGYSPMVYRLKASVRNCKANTTGSPGFDGFVIALEASVGRIMFWFVCPGPCFGAAQLTDAGIGPYATHTYRGYRVAFHSMLYKPLRTIPPAWATVFCAERRR